MPSVVAPDTVTGADHDPFFGFVAACTRWRVPSQKLHTAVTFPLASTETGANSVSATPPAVPSASVLVLHPPAVEDLTATWTRLSDSPASS